MARSTSQLPSCQIGLARTWEWCPGRVDPQSCLQHSVAQRSSVPGASKVVPCEAPGALVWPLNFQLQAMQLQRLSQRLLRQPQQLCAAAINAGGTGGTGLVRLPSST